MRRYDTAIVGTGGVAGLHAADLGRLGGRARLVAAMDVDPARLAEFADRWSVPQRHHDLAELLAQARPEVVHLCTPPGLHREQALACLAAGATVVCEKPPALSLAELAEIAAAEAAGPGRFVTVSQHRFGSAAARLRRLVADGTLGRPMTAVCHTLWYRPDEYFAVPWRGRWDIEGGGPTMGHGIHQMDLLLSILGPWREVVAVADRRARPTGTEDVSAALVTLDDGTVVTVLNSLLAPRQTSYLRFDFERATVELEHLYGYDDDAWRLTPVDDSGAGELALAWAGPPAGRPSGHAAQFEAIFDALDRAAAPPVSVADAYTTLELVAAIYASAFTGARVRRGELTADSPFYHRMDGTGAPWAQPATAADDPPAARG